MKKPFIKNFAVNGSKKSSAKRDEKKLKKKTCGLEKCLEEKEQMHKSALYGGLAPKKTSSHLLAGKTSRVSEKGEDICEHSRNKRMVTLIQRNISCDKCRVLQCSNVFSAFNI